VKHESELERNERGGEKGKKKKGVSSSRVESDSRKRREDGRRRDVWADRFPPVVSFSFEEEDLHEREDE